MSREKLDIQLILVPAGVEHWAVKRGLRQVKDAPRLIAIPAGPQGVKTFFKSWEEQNFQAKSVLLMGLGGGLSLQRQTGDAVVLACVFNEFEGDDEVFECDAKLTKQIAERLGASIGVGVTCDRVITTAAEKRVLCDRYHADVVDMESAALLKVFSSEIKEKPTLNRTAVLRVISDTCHYNLPNISEVIAPDGSLKPFLLFKRFITHPIAAIRLFSGSLKGLIALEKKIYTLFK